MEDQNLLNDMVLFNPWWSAPVSALRLQENAVQRELFQKLESSLNEKRVSAVIGPRRTGKTTLIKQMIQQLLEDMEPDRIIYFSMDGVKKEERIIRRIFDLYFRSILKKVPHECEKVYFFLDEVQKIRDWGEEIKYLYDMDYPVKFIVTGSSAMNILKGSGESLVGRIQIFRLYPFSFGEFLQYEGIEAPYRSLFDTIYPSNAAKLTLMFDRYLLIGGYPELYRISEPEKIRDYIKTILDLTLFRDIVNLFDVKRIDVLEGIFYSTLRQSGNVINYHTLTSDLNTKYETLKNYIEYLIISFFVSRSYQYSKSTLKSLKKNPKMYAGDNAFFQLLDTKEGLKVETVVYNHLRHLGADTFFWHGKSQLEVDILIQTTSGLLPVEVKYRKTISSGDLKGILTCMQEMDINRGIVVTFDRFGQKQVGNKQIFFIPAWLFLLTQTLS